jgi:hypothetical protein
VATVVGWSGSACDSTRAAAVRTLSPRATSGRIYPPTSFLLYHQVVGALPA